MQRSAVHAHRLPLILLAAGAALGCSADGSKPSGRVDAGPGDAGPPADAGPRPDTGPRDAGFDATPCGALELCGGSCVDTASDPSHCGACDSPCEAPADATPTCEASSCGFRCDPGFAEVDGACLEAPRPLWPPSLSTAVSHRPSLRWELPEGLSDATVELCGDRACTTVLETLAVTGTETQPTTDLPAGNVFWRITADGRSGPTWLVRVGARSVDADRAWGIYPDYDGDGYGDVAVGAPRADDSEGRAYVHLGGPEGTPAGVSAILRSPDGAGAEFALAMSCAGDLNGDGYADVAVGAPRAAGTAGRVHVHLGGPRGPGESADLTLESPGGAGSLFGGAVAGAGDVNGDGYGDLLVGAIGEGVTPGRVHLYLGGRLGPEGAPSVSFAGSGRFASALAGAGDVNGDGHADVLIGAYGAATSPGVVHLHLGSESGIADTPDRTYEGPDGNGGQFGFSVAGLGDVNGDGYADFAAGAPAANGSRGRVHVFHGQGAAAPDGPALSVDGVNAGGGFFGHSVAGLGDGNADGYADLAVGAFGVDDRRGRVAVLVGSGSGIVSTSRTTLEGVFGGQGDFGWAVSSAGDVDGNGRDDLVVGAPGVSDRAGRAYVYRGGPGGVGTTPLVSLIGASGGAFGRALAHADR